MVVLLPLSPSAGPPFTAVILKLLVAPLVRSVPAVEAVKLRGATSASPLTIAAPPLALTAKSKVFVPTAVAAKAVRAWAPVRPSSMVKDNVLVFRVVRCSRSTDSRSGRDLNPQAVTCRTICNSTVDRSDVEFYAIGCANRNGCVLSFAVCKGCIGESDVTGSFSADVVRSTKVKLDGGFGIWVWGRESDLAVE